MIIKGLQKTTLLDYPGKIACTIFLPGCNMRCPFCHNGGLVRGEGEDISEEDLFAFLTARAGKLRGVCISGGEPTLHPDLPELMKRIKELGYSVKLDSNGTNPEMLSRLLDARLVDYVAMDIKNSPEKYLLTAGCENPNILDKVSESVAILLRRDVEYELRTTVTVEHHTEADMESIGRWIGGAEKYYLQFYRPDGDQLVGGFTTPDSLKMASLLSTLKAYIPSAEIRG